MQINAVNNIYNQGQVANQAKLPTGAAAKETVSAFEKVITNVGAMQSTDVKKTMNGISEGISSIEDQLKADAKAAKANLKALFNKLSGAEAEKLDENGFDINDIDDEELVTVVDRIKVMLAAYNENYKAFSGAFDVAGSEEVAEGAGNLAAKVAAKLSDGYMPATEENVKDVMSTMEMAEDIAGNMPLSSEAKAYMLDNELEPTIENVYKATHSTVEAANNRRGNQNHVNGRDRMPQKQWEQIRPQVDKILEAAGLEKSEATYNDAKWLIANELPVTAENFVLKYQLDKLTFRYNADVVMTAATESMAAGNKASDASLVSDYNVWKDAAKAINTVNTVTEDQIMKIEGEGRRVTIEEMINEMEGKVTTQVTAQMPSQSTEHEQTQNAKQVTEGMSVKVLYETRILMTANSTVSLLNRGIDIYSEDLHNLVELLRQEETKYINEQLTKANGGGISETDLAQVSATNAALFELKFMPCAAIGQMVSVESELTITSVASISANMQRQYNQAGQAYETMSTQVRSDMGDSIKKAMKASSESILGELGYDVTEMNLRAVRILAYNSMEISEANFVAVRNVDSILNSLMDNMQPQVVLDMIRDQINPMETDIETLNHYINDNYSVQEEAVKYSEFLYKLEHTEGLSEEERSEYIGIYKVLNTLKRDGGKAVGALLNQEAQLNLKNMIMAVNSRKRYSMDVSLSEDAGMAKVEGSLYYENLFAKMEKKVSPGALKKTREEFGNLDELSADKLYEEIMANADCDKELRREFFEEMVEEAKVYQDVEDSVIRLLTDNSQPVTFYNVMAASELMKGNKFFRDLRERGDEEIDKAMDGIFEALSDKDTLDEAYENLRETVVNAGNSAVLAEGNDSYLDINELKNFGKTVNLISSLSNRQQYFVPFVADGSVGSINLKIVKTEVNVGKVEMSFATENLGNVYVEMQVSEVAVGKMKATGYIVSDKAEAVDLIKENVDNIAKTLEKLGISSAEIRASHSKSMPLVSLYNDGNGAPSATIYRAAKEILTNLLGV